MKNILNKSISVCICLLMMPMICSAQDIQNVKPVKNIILMIPDGCSLATVSTARWYQWMKYPEMEKLTIDPYLCGTVRTTCSNAPIGDSAPTTSAYMTGYNSMAGWVATYPTSSGKDDIYPVDPQKAYQPLATVMEASRLLKNKSTGLVCTCIFSHATPADCSSHSYNRNRYDVLASQQAHNGINVVLGGGAKYMSSDMEEYLKGHGVSIFQNDLEGARKCENNNMWSLFTVDAMSHDLDRDATKEPSLAEMTEIAIKKLSADKDGFILMVEGSQVDDCAHCNDPIGMVTEFLAFDRACKVALDFAKKNGETAVVILPDHGNSGISIGKKELVGYSRIPSRQIFGPLLNYKATCDGMRTKLNNAPFEDAEKIFKEWCDITLSEKEMNALKNNPNYVSSPIPRAERQHDKNYDRDLAKMIGQFMTARTGLTYTTWGHTGEDVFLAAYHPEAESRPRGMLTNIELNHYLCNLAGFTHDDLDKLTADIFVPHTEVFKDMQCEIADNTLTVIYNGNKAIIKPNTNVVTINGKDEELKSVVIYVDKNNKYYLPRSLRSRMGAK